MATVNTAEAPETAVVWMDPGELLTDRNIRDTVLDEEFLASVAELGVLEPVVALRTDDGRVRVWLGDRRVAAAGRTGRQVPVWIIGEEKDDRAKRRARLLGQYDENKHRRALTAGEEAGVVEALFELKMSAAAIGKRMKLEPGQVTAARAVAKSEVATRTADRHDMNLMESAVIAEFADAGDTEAIDALTAQHHDNPRQFEHLAQRLRDNTASRAERRAVTEGLEAAGVPVVAAQYQNKLTGLRGADGAEITPEGHAGCPGHGAYPAQAHERIDPPPESGPQYTDVWTAVYVCTDPDGNGHTRPAERTQPDKTEEERAAEQAKAKAVREGNKAWRSATTVRQKFLTGFAGRKDAPKDAAAFMAAYITGSGYALRQAMERGHPLGCEILGLPAPKDTTYYSSERKEQLAALTAAASPARQVLIGLVVLLAACEKMCSDVQTWQSEDNQYWSHRSDAAMYLAYLEAQGHVLSDAEAAVAHPQPAAAGPDPAADSAP